MIGETIKLGFDGTSVKRGLSHVMGGFRKLGRGIGRATRQVGIGMARNMGSDLFGLIVRGLRAIPNELSNLSDLRQEFFALGDATDASVEGLLALRHALAKTSNVSPNMAGLMLKTMTSKIGEGQEYGTESHKALRKMGISRRNIKGLNAEEQIRILAAGYKRVKDGLGKEIAANTMEKLFGAGTGKKIIPLLNSFEDSMTRARAETSVMAEQMSTLKGELDGLDDVSTAFADKLSETSLGFLGMLSSAGADTKTIAASIREINVAKPMAQAAQWIEAQLTQIKEGSLWEWIKTKFDELGDYLAKIISEAISSAVEDMNPFSSVKDGFMGLFGGDKSTSSMAPFNFKNDPSKLDPQTKTIAENTSQTNEILRNLEFGTSTFA